MNKPDGRPVGGSGSARCAASVRAKGRTSAGLTPATKPRSAVKSALIAALTAVVALPSIALDAAPADAHPRGWGRPYHRPGPVRYRPWYGPVVRPRRGPILVVPPPVVYVEPPPRVVYVEPPPRVIVREERVVERVPEERVVEHAPEIARAPAPEIDRPAPPPPRRAPEPRELLGFGLHVTGAAVEGDKVGISTAENPGMGGLGLHLRGRFSEAFGIELSADFLEGSADDVDLTQSTLPLMAGLTWHILPTSRFQPYLVAGAGVHFTRLEYFGGDYAIDLTELAGQLGGGLEVFLTENLALHADLRLQSVFKDLDTRERIASDCVRQIGAERGFCDDIHDTDDADKVDLGAQLQLGVSWYF